MRVRDAQTDGGHAAAMAGRGLIELLGVTVDFWGGVCPPASPMASGGPAPLAQMYRDQLGLGRRARWCRHV